MTCRVLCAGLALLVCDMRIAAQDSLRLEFQSGRVWLVAHEVSTRMILKEWSRLSGATIVNGDDISDASVTLELDGVPEPQALEVVLRGVAGYILGSRVDDSTGESTIDRIVVLAKSTLPIQPTPTESRVNSRNEIPPGLTGPLADALRAAISNETTRAGQNEASRTGAAPTDSVQQPPSR